MLGLTFRKDLYLASSQIFPALEDSEVTKRPLTRLQVSCDWWTVDSWPEYSPVIGAGAADQEARRQRLPVLLRAAAALPRQRDAAARAGGHRCDQLLFKQPNV